MERYTKYDDLIAPWKTDPTTRQTLIKRIRQQALQTPGSPSNVFTEEKIAQQYYKTWLELPPTASLQIIAQHPLMNKQMKAKIDEQLWQQKQSMLKWSAGLTGVCVVIYVVFLSRMPKFARFFNNPDSYMVTRGVKKTLGVYGIFLGWVASLTSSYEKAMPDELEKKGLAKDLQIILKRQKN